MKYLIVILLLIDPIKQLNKVAKINKAKKTAQEAYRAHDYKKAIRHYTILLDSLEVEDDKVLLNLANAYHKSKDTANAINSYQILTSSENNQVKSIAQQQLGVIQFRDKKYETALTYFKEALKANPNNDNARYNYELTKKIIDKKKKEEEDKKDKNKDKDKKDQKKEDKKKEEGEKKDDKKDDKKQDKGDKKEEDKKDKNKDKDQKKEDKKKEEGKKKDDKKKGDKKGEKSDEKEKKDNKKMSQETKDNLQKIKISPQKAKMILEAMKNQEVQYLQQAKKKSKKNTKTSNKPDW